MVLVSQEVPTLIQKCANTKSTGLKFFLCDARTTHFDNSYDVTIATYS